MCRLKPELHTYHHDQTSTLSARAVRHVISSTILLGPQEILACPVISGLRSRELLSISVVTIIVLFALTELLAEGAVFSPALELPCADVAMEVTFP